MWSNATSHCKSSDDTLVSKGHLWIVMFFLINNIKKQFSKVTSHDLKWPEWSQLAACSAACSEFFSGAFLIAYSSNYLVTKQTKANLNNDTDGPMVTFCDSIAYFFKVSSSAPPSQLLPDNLPGKDHSTRWIVHSTALSRMTQSRHILWFQSPIPSKYLKINSRCALL